VLEVREIHRSPNRIGAIGEEDHLASRVTRVNRRENGGCIITPVVVTADVTYSVAGYLKVSKRCLRYRNNADSE